MDYERLLVYNRYLTKDSSTEQEKYVDRARRVY